jgi:adenine-specific DNA-methyltransferase
LFALRFDHLSYPMSVLDHPLIQLFLKDASEYFANPNTGWAKAHTAKVQFAKSVIIPELLKILDEEVAKLTSDPSEAEKLKIALLDKLYEFFSNFLSPDGTSLGFLTVPKQLFTNETIQNPNLDTQLLWKSKDFIYVKSDYLFKSMHIEVDGYKFFFDTSTLEYKKSDEKRELLYEFIGMKDDSYHLLVKYLVHVKCDGYKSVNPFIWRSEIKNQNKISEFLNGVIEKIKNNNPIISCFDAKTFVKAVRKYERHKKPVEYFICKDAKTFLTKQFEAWLGMEMVKALNKYGRE